MRFADAGYAVLKDDATVQISESQYNGYLREIGISVGSTSEFPHEVKVELGDNVIIETVVFEESVSRYVKFGDISYGADGSLNEFSVLRSYYMNYDIYDQWVDGVFVGDVYDFGSGSKTLYHLEEGAARAFNSYTMDNKDKMIHD